MTCRQAVDVLVQFLGATLDAEAALQLERHLAGCDECRAYLATLRRTVGVVGKATRTEMPDELRRRLRAFLFERLRLPR